MFAAMTPAARLEAAIEILEALNETNQAADRFLRDWFRTRRYAGARDRAAVGERVFTVLRHRASLAWRMQSTSPRALVMGSLLADGRSRSEIEALFSGAGYGPAPLDEAERARLARDHGEPPPLWVEGEFPEFLETELVRSLGDRLREEMQAMLERAAIDLRVNTLKATRDDVIRELQEAGFAVAPTPWAPYGIRIVERDRASQLRSACAFLEGRFEFQDEAAQIASLLCGARPGSRILDLAAGAGGKALALAAEMHNEGVIVAHDKDAVRLNQLGPRAARAGVTIIERLADAEPAKGMFDTVLVDAPCSGSGAWRRQPEQKWRLTPERLAELRNTQDRLLDAAAATASARIVYANCSVLKFENEDRIEAFLARHRDFRVAPATAIWHKCTGARSPPGMDTVFKATPLTTGTDGFFTAVLVRAV